MKRTLMPLPLSLLGAFMTSPVAVERAAPLLNDSIAILSDYRSFRLIAVSQRTDEHALRAILGNDVAIAAVRSGTMNPWPNGAVLAKLTWKQTQSDTFPSAQVPSEFIGAAFMVKDNRRYASTGGWGWGEWTGLELKPYDKPGAAQECVACHLSVKAQDLVFTRPASLP